MGYPVTDEGSCTGLGGRVRQWYSVRSSGNVIDTKEMLHALRLQRDPLSQYGDCQIDHLEVDAQ